MSWIFSAGGFHWIPSSVSPYHSFANAYEKYLEDIRAIDLKGHVQSNEWMKVYEDSSKKREQVNLPIDQWPQRTSTYHDKASDRSSLMFEPAALKRTFVAW